MKPKKEFLIYGLRDPRTEEIRYVGKSSYGLSRPNIHRRKVKSKGPLNYKDYWIASLLSKGLDYEIVILQRFITDEGLAEAECWWIAVGKAALGKRFTNLTEGGEGVSGYVYTEAQISRMCARQKKQASTPEGRAHLEKMWKKRDEPEARKKLSESSRKRYSTPEGLDHLKRIQKLSNTVEARQKRSKKAIERWKRPDQQEILAAGLTKGREWGKTPQGREVKRKNGKARAATPEGMAQMLSALEKAYTLASREKIATASRIRSKTPEGRAQFKLAQEALRQFVAKMTPEQLSARSRNIWVNISSERRSDIARKREALKTPEQCRARLARILFTEEESEVIRSRILNGEMLRDLAIEYNVNAVTISKIKHGKYVCRPVGIEPVLCKSQYRHGAL